MKKVLITQNIIPHYRKALYNKLSEKYDLTIFHSGKPSIEDTDLYKEIISETSKIGPITIQKGLLKELRSNNYDTVIAMFDIHWIINVIAFFFYRKKLNFIWWGIGESSKGIGNTIRKFLIRKNARVIFYTKRGLDFFKNQGVDTSKFNFCNNTILIENRIKCFEEEKDSLLFVGSLNKRKQNDVLIRAFGQIKSNIQENVKLNIVGGGNEEVELKELVKNLGLEKSVIFHGAINDSNRLIDFYKKAFCSVSFGQAGLSVLQSIGFGVPFVTKKNAISGGEMTNITHDENGILCEDNQKSLENALFKLINDKEFSRNLGENAFNHYSNFCTIENMSSKFVDQIEA